MLPQMRGADGLSGKLFAAVLAFVRGDGSLTAGARRREDAKTPRTWPTTSTLDGSSLATAQ